MVSLTKEGRKNTVRHKVEQHILELAHVPEDSCRAYSAMT